MIGRFLSILTSEALHARSHFHFGSLDEFVSSSTSSNAESPFSSSFPYYYQIDWLRNISKEGQRGMQKTEANIRPTEHAQHIANMLQQAQQECRVDIGQIDDPK